MATNSYGSIFNPSRRRGGAGISMAERNKYKEWAESGSPFPEYFVNQATGRSGRQSVSMPGRGMMGGGAPSSWRDATGRNFETVGQFADWTSKAQAEVTKRNQNKARQEIEEIISYFSQAGLEPPKGLLDSRLETLYPTQQPTLKFAGGGGSFSDLKAAREGRTLDLEGKRQSLQIGREREDRLQKVAGAKIQNDSLKIAMKQAKTVEQQEAIAGYNQLLSDMSLDADTRKELERFADDVAKGYVEPENALRQAQGFVQQRMQERGYKEGQVDKGRQFQVQQQENRQEFQTQQQSRGFENRAATIGKREAYRDTQEYIEDIQKQIASPLGGFLDPTETVTIYDPQGNAMEATVEEAMQLIQSLRGM